MVGLSGKRRVHKTPTEVYEGSLDGRKRVRPPKRCRQPRSADTWRVPGCTE